VQVLGKESVNTEMSTPRSRLTYTIMRVGNNPWECGAGQMDNFEAAGYLQRKYRIAGTLHQICIEVSSCPGEQE
jgi:hypothetical protein